MTIEKEQHAGNLMYIEFVEKPVAESPGGSTTGGGAAGKEAPRSELKSRGRRKRPRYDNQLTSSAALPPIKKGQEPCGSWPG